ncbi:MAG: hypothetical protein WAV21_03260 [Minisyncoccia bacterium]
MSEIPPRIVPNPENALDPGRAEAFQKSAKTKEKIVLDASPVSSQESGNTTKEYKERLSWLVSQFQKPKLKKGKEAQRNPEKIKPLSPFAEQEFKKALLSTSNASEVIFSERKNENFLTTKKGNSERILSDTKAFREALAVARAEDAGIEIKKAREDMLAAEQAYLEEEKKFHKKHSLLGRKMASQLGKIDLQKTEAEYNEKSLAFEKVLEDRLKNRLAIRDYSKISMFAEERDEEGNVLRIATNPEDFAKKVAARYRRMMISRDIIDRGATQLAETRAAALDAKGKKTFDKALGWVAGLNKGLEDKLGKRGARAARILTGAAVGAFAGSLTGGAGFLWGFGTRTMRAVLGTSFGAAAGYGAGKAYMATLGKGAAEKLAAARETAATDAKGIKAKRKAYASGTEEAIARKRALVESLTAVLTGAGVSMESARLFAENEIVTQALSDASDSVNPVSAPEALASVLPPSPLLAVTSVEVRTGEGAIGLFKHLQQQLQETYASVDRATLPHSVQHMLTLSPQELAKEYGFYNPSAAAESALIPRGATLGIDPGGSLVYEAPTAHGSHLMVLEQGSTASVTPFHGTMQDTDASSRPTQGPVTHSETRAEVDARERAETARLMTEQHLRNVEAQRAFDAQRTAPPVVPETAPVPTAPPTIVPETTRVSPVAPVEVTQVPRPAASLSDSEKFRILSEWSKLHKGEPWPPGGLDYDKAAAELANPEVSSSSVESQPLASLGQVPETPVISQEGIVQGIDGLTVNTGEAHVYQNTDDSFVVFGGTEETRSRLTFEFLQKNPRATILVESYTTNDKGLTIPWKMVNGEPVPGEPIRDTFLGFGGFASEPDPTTFKSKIL